MLFFFLIGILIGIYLDQELESLPKLKPFLVSTLQTFQQASSTAPHQTAAENGEKDHTASENGEKDPKKE